jgi:hypothetical protein
MPATYQELLKKSYIQRLSNQKDGNDILNTLDVLVNDYAKDVQGWGVVDTSTEDDALVVA